MQFPYVGNIDIKNLEECYEAEVQLNGVAVDVDINFAEEVISQGDADHLAGTLNELSKYADIAMKSIEKDWNSGENSETAREYVEIHEDIFDDLFGLAADEVFSMPFSTLSQSLSLSRIGVYPDEEDYYLICDIHFSSEMTNYLMAVAITRGGTLDSIALES